MIWREYDERGLTNAPRMAGTTIAATTIAATTIAVPLVAEVHVECRTGGGAWWHFAWPAVAGPFAHDGPWARRRGAPRPDVLAGLFLGMGEAEDDLVGALGVPLDASARTAERYARYRARRGREGHVELATWVDARELSRVLTTLERRDDSELAPATWCALLAMMQTLERDYETRAVLWFDAPETDLEARADG